MGYYQAAQELGIKIEIVGVDIEPQPNYPFNFIQADAVEYLISNGHKYTHIHASPPCQKYTQQSAIYRKQGKEYSDLLEIIRPIIHKLRKPSVIENVMSSPIRPDIVLRGDLFGLKTLRKRKFELNNWFMLQPGIQHIKRGAVVHDGKYITITGNGNLGSMNKKKQFTKFIHARGTVLKTWSEVMRIDWMTCDELREAIPPLYTRYIGLSFFTYQTYEKSTIINPCTSHRTD